MPNCPAWRGGAWTLSISTGENAAVRLVRRAAAGEEIIIAKAGRPLARLNRCRRTTPRPLGLLAGQVRIGRDFDDPLPEDVVAAFRGKTE